MSTITVDLVGKTEVPHGVGARVVEGSMSIKSYETLTCDNLGLRTIHSVVPVQPPGTILNVYVGAPGTFGNQGSVSGFHLATTTSAIATTVALAFRYIAMGE